MWKNIKNSKIFAIGVLKRDTLFKEIMAEIFANIVVDTNLQIQEAQQNPHRIRTKKITKTSHQATENKK